MTSAEKPAVVMESPKRELEREREAELSPTSPNEDSDSGFLSPPPDPEPYPGLHGTPVRCKWVQIVFCNVGRLT